MCPADATPVCVFCRRHAVDPKWRPFCSERCRLQDLARWADGSYRAPGEPAGGDEAAAHEDDPSINRTR
jgi:uncharacterized protein